MKKTILITGVAGFIGSRLADWIIENRPEFRVIGVDDLSGGYEENVNPHVIFHKMDVLDNKLEILFKEFEFEYVFHFAAYAAEALSPFIRKYNYTNNLVATANVINNCIQYEVKRLVFSSSIAVYGHGYGGVFDEEQVPKPVDPYGVSKYACEMDIQIAGEQHGLDWCIIRPHNVYGIKQNISDKYRNVLGIWMNQFLHNQPLSIYGDGKQTRAFSYIDDMLEPLWKTASDERASKQIINIGAIEESTIEDAANLLIEIMGGGQKKYLEHRHEVKHSIPTHKKSFELLGFAPKTTLRDGIAKMWDWAKGQPVRESAKWKNYEMDKKVYSFWK